MKSLLIVFSLAVTACGSNASESKESPPSNVVQVNPCVTPEAAYQLHWTTVSGNCGPVPDSVLVISSNGTVSDDGSVCDNKSEVQECSVLVNVSCKTAAPNGVAMTIKEKGKADWRPDGTGAKATLSVEISAADGSSCAGLYTVSYSRL